MNSRMFFAAVAVLSVIVLAALSAALPSALLPGNTAYAQTNSAPQFPSSETGTRTVDENTPWYQNIGDPVVATDPDDDKLTYSLENARTSPFTIDRFTGQLQTGAPLDYETQATYTAKVIAADRLEPDDPSRATDTITVTIDVNNVDEPGKVSLTWTRLQVGAEVEASLTDPDGNVSGVTWHWEKPSDRSSWTAISTATQATYTPVGGDVNRYLRAVASYTDPLGAEKTAWSAAAFVKPVPDPNQTPDFWVNTGGGYDCRQGETADVCLYIERHAPPGSEIHYPGYVDITDHDQVRYSIGGADAVKFRIGPLSGDLYTTDAHAYDNPGTDDIFEITITATDPSGRSDSIDVALRPSGSAGSPTVRGPEEIRYPENGTWPLATYSATASNPDRDIHGWIISGENIGAPVTAADPDTGDTLTYTLEGADLDSFGIDSASGQIQTKSGVTYDHEVKSSYSVTVKADDNNGGTATIDVTITVADVNEPPEFSVETASRTIAENTTTGVAIGAPVTATDPDTGDTLTYTLEGANLDSFDIDSASGQIQTKSGVTYDHEIKSSYSVTVKADDNNGGTATIDVTITVADVNEPPEFDSATATREVPENTEAGGNIGAPVTATDPDTGDTPAYTLGGTDATFFDIDTLTGQLQTQAALDYETKSGYTVTVTASDGTLTATVDVTVTVTNVDEAGTVALSTNQPPARAEITAALTDPDEGVTGAVWQWERSSDGNTDWADIGTSSPSYTPVDGDVGYHLRATASYTDGHGPGKTAQAASTQAVQAGANRPPEFDSATATREVPENTEAGENIGSPITANDPDNDTLTYTLGGTDASSFDIGRSTGQITVGAGTALDYAAGASYTVSVTAADPSGSSAAIGVTIAVFDEDLGELGSRYDTDNDRVIGRDEAISAIIDYFADLITRDEVVGVIILYFAS